MRRIGLFLTVLGLAVLTAAGCLAARNLAEDLYQGCPMGQGTGIYDCDWDRKYLHGGK